MSRELEEGKPFMHHFNVGAYESLSEESEDTIEHEYLNSTSPPKESNVFSWWNIAMTAGFVGATMLAVSYLPYQLKGKVVEMAETKETLKSGSAGKPNFIFVLADDVAWNSMGYMGYDIQVTNYMDNLAKNGIILTNYYAQEVCTPSRASLMTGRYPISIGMQYGEVMPEEDLGVHLSETMITEVLSQNGYKTYGLGKWNLGHFSPQYLPTARGFDSYLGYMDGYNHYWSKRDPYYDDSEQFLDFMIMDHDCYGLYEGEDRDTYSTTFYMNKAIDLINYHDFDSYPLFLYMPVTAAHDPFADYDNTHPDGVTAEEVGQERYDKVQNTVVGEKRQQYAYSLALLDDAVMGIHGALKEKGQEENTIIIFASDNGGCYLAGGRTAPLKGTKGTLWEGGVRVPSFIYSPLLGDAAKGTEYSNIFHVSDWFSTILGFAGIEYEAPEDKPLDGYDHSQALTLKSNEVPREYLIYNMWMNVSHQTFNDLTENVVFAVRNAQYKLIHSYNTAHSDYYEYDTEEGGDDDISTTTSCSQSTMIKGTYKKFLYDIANDPYETTNLYADTDDIQAIIDELFDVAKQKSSVRETWTMSNSWAEVKFSEGGYLQPWDFNITHEYGSYPNKCTALGVFQYQKKGK